MDSSLVNDPSWGFLTFVPFLSKIPLYAWIHDKYMRTSSLVLHPGIALLSPEWHFEHYRVIFDPLPVYSSLRYDPPGGYVHMTLHGTRLRHPLGGYPHMSQDVIFLVRLTEMSSYGGMWAGFAQIHVNLTLFDRFLSVYRWVVISITILCHSLTLDSIGIWHKSDVKWLKGVFHGFLVIFGKCHFLSLFCIV